MIKFLMVELPLFLNSDWFEMARDVDWLRMLQDLDMLQMFLAIVPVVVLVCIITGQYPHSMSEGRHSIIVRKKVFCDEAALDRHENPLWFALGP